MAAPPLRWGVLAPGWIAGQFAAALRRGTRQEIVAAGSRSFHRARAFAEEHGAPTAYGSYDELVHDPQVDIVYIASPHSEHHRQARLALKAGKPVLVERHSPATPPRPATSSISHTPEACSCSKACGAGSCPTMTSCNRLFRMV